jgi:hypothetical protein
MTAAQRALVPSLFIARAHRGLNARSALGRNRVAQRESRWISYLSPHTVVRLEVGGQRADTALAGYRDRRRKRLSGMARMTSMIGRQNPGR